MKKSYLKQVIAFIAILFSTNLISQVSVSCDYIEVCLWNSYTKSFADCAGEKEKSLFEVNQNETIIVHTVEDMTSAYYIKESSFDEYYKTTVFEVVSDVGNHYTFFFDAKNEIVKILRKDGTLIIHHIKSVF